MTVSKARRNRVRELWNGVPETWRTEMMSAFHTFVPAFAATMVVFFQSAVDTTWTRETLTAATIAAVLAALRSGFKAVSMYIFSRTLPDPKDA